MPYSKGGYKKIPDRVVKDIPALVEAIKEVKIKHKKPFSVAASYGIAYNSFKRYIQRFEKRILDISQATDDELMQVVSEISTFGAPTVFTAEEEASLVDYLIRSSKFYYDTNITELRKMAYQFGKKLQVTYPYSWNANSMAGKDWHYGFMKRHPNLSRRLPDSTNRKRVKPFSENVNWFFLELQQLYAQYNFPAENIWNMDETMLSTVPNKVLSVRGLKKADITAFEERGTLVTLALAVNAMGGFIPPFFVFPGKLSNSFIDRSPTGSKGVSNVSGCMQQEEFLCFMQHFITSTKATKNQPNLLLLDNLSCHLSIEALDLAFEHGIVFFSFPPHCSHRMQPLDVSVYGPVQTFYKSQCAMWSQNNAGRHLEIHHIPEFVDRISDLALTPDNIKAGFRTTGIFPLNIDAFANVDFIITEYIAEVQPIKSTRSQVDEDQRVFCKIETLTELEGPSRSVFALSTKSSAPRQKSSLGRKSMKSAVLTATGKQERLEVKPATTTAIEPPAKRTKTTPTTNATADESKDFN